MQYRPADSAKLTTGLTGPNGRHFVATTQVVLLRRVNVECLEGLFDTWGTFGRGFVGNLSLGGADLAALEQSIRFCTCGWRMRRT